MTQFSAEDEEVLRDLFQRWAYSGLQGKPLDPVELCEEHTHLLPELQSRIKKFAAGPKSLTSRTVHVAHVNQTAGASAASNDDHPLKKSMPRRDPLVELAQHWFNKHDYEQVQTILMNVPALERSEDADILLLQTQDILEEIQSLTDKIEKLKTLIDADEPMEKAARRLYELRPGNQATKKLLTHILGVKKAARLYRKITSKKPVVEGWAFPMEYVIYGACTFIGFFILFYIVSFSSIFKSSPLPPAHAEASQSEGVDTLTSSHTNIPISGEANNIPLNFRALDELNSASEEHGPWISPDGMVLYWWTTSGSDSGQIWTAERKDTTAFFLNKKLVTTGTAPTLSGDQLQMIIVTGNSSQRKLSVLKRKSINDAFSAASIIPELQTYSLDHPSLSADGLTLVAVDLASPTGNFCVMKRATSNDAWSLPRKLELVANPVAGTRNLMSHPRLSADGLALWGQYTLQRSQGQTSEILRWTRSTSQANFDAIDLFIGGKAGTNLTAPALCESTHEIFFVNAASPGGLWVTRPVEKSLRHISSSHFITERSRFRHSGHVMTAAFSADNLHMASATDPGHIQLTEISSQQSNWSHDHSGTIGICTTIDSSKQQVLLVTSQNLIRYDLQSGNELQNYPLYLTDERCQQACFSPDYKYLLTTAGLSSDILIWNVSNGKLLKTLPGNATQKKHSITLDRTMFVDGDTSFDLLKATVEKMQQVLTTATEAVTATALAPDRKLMACVSPHSLTIFDLVTGHEIKQFRDLPMQLRTVAFSADGKYLVLAGGGTDDDPWAEKKDADRSIMIYELQSLEHVRTLFGHQAAVLKLVFNAEGNQLASTGADSQVIIWDFITWPESKSEKSTTFPAKEKPSTTP
jgi:WD40 repeat protein